ncbi:hypothetical protein [Amycolatopsis sp. TNS106]|uniref:hypothetical protein n=1 Tax=Amycolatopsis sp. TNS106 TaxID=2861750 RepID=UPI001C57ACAF|nr:hypothetical protein [Amycolatopsis sp. TNS106]
MTRSSKHQLHSTSNSVADYAASPGQQLVVPAVHAGVAPIESLSSGVVRIPGYRHTPPSLRIGTESTYFIVQGLVITLAGPELERTYLHSPHSIMMIGKGVPHVRVNLSAEVVMILESSTDPHFDSDVQPLHRLKTLAEARVAEVQNDYQCGRYHEQLQAASWNTVVWHVTNS